MKKFIEYLTTLAVFFTIISLPFIYYGFYKIMYRPDEPHFHQIITAILVISHILTAKFIYNKFKKG